MDERRRPRRGRLGTTAALALVAALAAWRQAAGADAKQERAVDEPGVEVSGPETREDGAVVYRIRSPYQRGTTLVRLLPPPEETERRRVLFVLPVEPGTQGRFGDGLATARGLRVPERYGFVVVAPTFSDWPWFADHPTDPLRRQEAYMLRVVVPLVARLYPHEPGRRALLGFSKSGWGAYSLLLRHPEAFGAACAWDAPMMMAKPRFEMMRVVGNLKNFERYRIPRLLREQAEAVRGARRLALLGYGNFRRDTQAAHELMARLGIPHVYADGPARKHHWDGGWMEAAVRALDAMLR
jgi:hypothetical protein